MSLTQKDTKKIVKEVVKALDPKFKKLTIEIGDMIAPLATKEELETGTSRLDFRIDEFEDRFEQFAGNVGLFESRVIQRFDDIDEKLLKHDDKFEQIIEHVKGHSALLRNHETRITALEKTV